MAKQPSCIIEEIVELDPKEFDGPLGTLLSKAEGDASKYLQVVFGYLQRKSNFFKEGDPQKRVLEAFKQVQGDAGLKTGFLGSKPASSKPAPAPAAPTAAAPTPPPAAPAASAPTVVPAPAAPASSTPVVVEPPSEAGPSIPTIPDAEEGAAEESKGLKPNSGRGYDFDHYSWTQTLSEVSVSVPIPSGTKAKMMDVQINKTKIKVGLKGQPPILEGELSEPVKTDDSMWNLDGKAVELTLAKQDGMHWWSSVLKGEQAIDVHKVEPENSKLGDLDAETRQTVEKMMFDQRQKALGLPTSEEMQRQEMLKKFMAAHPEMDFSNAKMM